MSAYVIAVVGATATGKSDFALDLAERLGGHIINADAMQLYRGMDIGTAKVTPEEQRGIPHYQLDVLDVALEASVAAYQRHARADVETIFAQGKVPIVVGGSGLYVQGLLDEMDFPGTDPEVRRRLEERAANGPRALWEELQEKDPAAAAVINPKNVRRVVRALEVIELTGEPFSANLPERIHHWPTVQFGLRADADVLDDRIYRRTLAMLDAGFIQEVEGLPELGPTASRATGYPQVGAYLRGELSREELPEAIALATRQLSRRQIKWFRRDPRTHWFSTDAVDSHAQAARVDEALAVVDARLG